MMEEWLLLVGFFFFLLVFKLVLLLLLDTTPLFVKQMPPFIYIYVVEFHLCASSHTYIILS